MSPSKLDIQISPENNKIEQVIRIFLNLIYALKISCNLVFPLQRGPNKYSKVQVWVASRANDVVYGFALVEVKALSYL